MNLYIVHATLMFGCGAAGGLAVIASRNQGEASKLCQQLDDVFDWGEPQLIGRALPNQCAGVLTEQTYDAS